MKNYANSKRRDVEYNVGDYVYIATQNFKLPSNIVRKFSNKYVGPYQVLQKISNVSYKVDLPVDFGKMHNVFHVSLLKPHSGSLPFLRQPVFDFDDEEFEVEKILQKRVSRNKIEYLVKWSGYGVYDATWEPVANLQNCLKKIEEFEKVGVRK